MNHTVHTNGLNGLSAQTGTCPGGGARLDGYEAPLDVIF